MENGDCKNDPMKRLVYKHDVIVALAEKIDEPIDFVEALKDLPIVDAVEVRHGQWLDRTQEPGWPDAECSVCGSHAGMFWMNYCPNCGARMDGGNNE